MTSLILEPIVHTIVALALLASYVTLRILGHDDPTLLGILGGQLGGLGITQVAQQAAGASRPIEPPPPTGVITSPAPPVQ